MVICLQLGADLHMAQLMPLPLTVSCFSKIQIGFTFLVPAHLGSPRQRAVKRVCVCVYLDIYLLYVDGRTCRTMMEKVRPRSVPSFLTKSANLLLRSELRLTSVNMR